MSRPVIWHRLAVLIVSTVALASCGGQSEQVSGPSPAQVAAETRAAEAEKRAQEYERRKEDAEAKASASEQKATTFGAGGLVFGFVTFIVGIVIGARTRKHAERRHEERP